MEKKEEFIRVGTTLYKIVDQPRIDGGYVRKRIAWRSETLRQDYGKDYMASVPKYDGFCTVPDHVGYKPVVGKFQVVKDPKNKSKLALTINGQVIGEWFKEQFGRLFSSVKRTVEPLRRDKGMGL